MNPQSTLPQHDACDPGSISLPVSIPAREAGLFFQNEVDAEDARENELPQRVVCRDSV